MPGPSSPSVDLDDRLARLGRQWFAEIRSHDRDEGRKAKPKADGGDGGDGGGFLDWLLGESDDADGGGEGGCGD